METPRYSRAPITEAIIDLRVNPDGGVTVERLEASGAEESSRYPKKKRINVTLSQVDLGGEAKGTATATATTQHVGFSYQSADDKQLFQFRLDGFSFVRLAPYDRWEPFRDEARRLWVAYRQITAQPAHRVAVRYVNRLDLPLPLNEFKDYLRTVPEVSPDLPQALGAFFMHLTIPQDDIKSVLLLNETVVDPVRSGVVSVVLDLDLIRQVEIPVDDDGIWSLFETLHTRKNEIFEGCITPATRALIR